MKTPRAKNYVEYISRHLDECRINEELHVYKNCRNAIDDIAKRIYDLLCTHDYTDFNTGYAYCPELKRTVFKDETEYNDALPIYINFEDTDDYDMLLNDRKNYPADIVINVSIHLEDRYSDFNYGFVHYKLIHEFGHIRQNYGQRYVDISQKRKFMSADIDEGIFDFQDDNLKAEAMALVKNFMYFFAPSEMQQRCSELYDALDNKTDDELVFLCGEYTNHGECVAYVLEHFENIHGIEYLKRRVEQCRIAEISNQYLIVLIIAWYFKEANLYKPKNKLQRGFIQSFLDGEMLSEADKIYADEFIRWIDNHLRKYIHNIYIIVHYVLYNRLWNWTYSKKDTRKTKNINEMRAFFERQFNMIN